MGKSTTIEVTLSQESVDAIAKAVADAMFNLLKSFLTPLHEELQEIESNTSRMGY